MNNLNYRKLLDISQNTGLPVKKILGLLPNDQKITLETSKDQSNFFQLASQEARMFYDQ